MPSFNHARYIREAIDSVLNQDYPLIDLLVMDGGSTDSTVDILKSYGDRLQFISQKDKGQSDAINRGFRMVKGDILCWLNSDDLFSRGAISTVMDVFSKSEEIEWVYGDGCAIDDNGRFLGNSGVLPFSLWKLIHHRNFIQQPSCFFRKSLLEKVGPIDESLYYVMDWELWIRFGAYRVKFIQERLSSNRTYPQNKTQSGHFRRWKEIRKVVRRYTRQKYPPILFLYFLEVLVQILRSKNIPNKLIRPLAHFLELGMMRELNGHYPDGGIERQFRFSLGNHQKKDLAIVSILPASAVCPERLGAPPVRIKWESSSQQSGLMIMEENGRDQKFELPLGDEGKCLFEHFLCTSNIKGSRMHQQGQRDDRQLIGFLSLP
jgi:glycosyltransferase involved in cell wall biosynthesis